MRTTLESIRDSIHWIILGFMISIFLIMIGYVIGRSSAESRIEKELINRGFAKYNEDTGCFEFIPITESREK